MHTALPLLIEFFVLTAVRENEGIMATWGRIDTKRGVLTVPTGKNGNTKRKDEREVPREIPITSHLLDLFERAKKKCIEMGIDPSNPNAPVFPGMRRGPHRRSSCCDFLQRIWEGKITLHGLRSTLRDWCRASGYPGEWWEIQVDHKLGKDESDAAYGHDPLLEQRRGMMEAWGRFCDRTTPAAGTNVAQINEARKRRRVA
jgi:integrase